MLRKRSSFSNQISSSSSSSSSSPASSSLPSRPGTSTSNYSHSESTSGVRRALSTLQNALHSNWKSPLEEKQSSIAIVGQQSHLTVVNRQPNYSNGTSDSLYTSGSTMTPHTTTDDDSSSSSSRPFQRPRQLSKAGSLPSPLGSYLHNDSLVPSNKSLQGTETGSSVASSINGYASIMPISSNHVQLRVRDLEHSISYSGYLTKFTSRTFFSRKQWKRRYFILHQSSLYCFKSSDPQHPLLESIKLCPDTIICVTDIFSGKRYCLQITTPGEKSWYVLADTANEMSGWLRELKGTVLRFRNRSLGLRPGTHYSDSSEMSDLSSSSVMADSMHAVPSIPTQYDSFTLVSRSPSPPPRPPPPPQQLDLYQLSTTPITHIHDTRRRRKNSSMSVAQSHAEYASFGTVMEQADALLPEESQNSSLPSSTVEPDPSADDYRPPSRSASVRSNGSTNGRRVSIVVDRPETMITLPRRSSQRLMGSPSRPMSPVSSRPTSPNFNRPGNRSSLVVSPPPRSIHRPSSVSVRHSTQGLPLSLQMANMSIQSSDSDAQNPLSRATSLRLDPVSRVGYTLTGSLQERSYRSPSRPSIITSYSRPTSPTPSLSSAPTSPLPEAPRSESPVSTLKHTFSNGSSHRIQIVPRHHDPDQLLKHRPSNSRSRTKSQETSLDHIAARANTPSPRLSAAVTKNENDTPPTSLSTSAPKLSLYNGDFTLPPPPTGEQPEPPTAVTSSRASSPIPGRPSPALIHHKHSLSNSSLRSVGSSSSVGSPSFGSAICKKSSNRDSVLSARLSSLTPIPLGATVSVPSPPQMALPPIPIQEVPECSAGNDDEAREGRLPEIVEELPSQNEDPEKQQQ